MKRGTVPNPHTHTHTHEHGTAHSKRHTSGKGTLVSDGERENRRMRNTTSLWGFKLSRRQRMDRNENETMSTETKLDWSFLTPGKGGKGKEGRGNGTANHALLQPFHIIPYCRVREEGRDEGEKGNVKEIKAKCKPHEK